MHPRHIPPLLTCVLVAALCVPACSFKAIILDVSLKHTRKIQADLQPYVNPRDFITMSMNQTGGPDATSRRVSRMMRWHNSSLVLPFAMFQPKSSDEMRDALERARKPGSMEHQLCDTLPRDPLLLERTFMSAGNAHTLNYFPELCETLGHPHIKHIKLVGSCVIGPTEQRYMRDESGTEEWDSVRDAQRPRPDILICVPSIIKSLDTSPAAVLAGIFYEHVSTGVISCTHLWSRLNPIDAIPGMVHPKCGGFRDPTGVPVIDVKVT